MSALTNWFTGLYYDTIGQEDKAKELLGLHTLEAKKKYWAEVAVLTGIVGIGLAGFTAGISLLLLIVTALKVRLILTKKE